MIIYFPSQIPPCRADSDEAPPGIDVDHFADPTTSAQHNEIKLDKSTEDGGFYQLVQGRSIDIPEHASGTHLEVFCYKGEAKKLQTFFKTVELQLTIKENTFHYYEAENASMVRHMHSQSSWFSFTPWQPSSFRLDLYKKSCVGIETTASYTVSLRARFLDVWRVCLLCGGVLVFSGAPALARNLLFHYLSASCLAVVGSFLIVLILLAKFIPKRSGAVTFMLGGSGLFLYLAQLLYTNFVTLINEYYNIFLGYISCTAVISFCVMYRCGGVSDVRTLQLLQWLLQGGGLLAVYCSSQYREVALAAVLLLLAYHNTPSVLSTTVKSAWRRKFPPKVRLLTEEEFIQQGNVATAKALEDLRNYCRSPDCNAWKTLSRLRSPQSLDRKEPRPYRPCRSRIPRFAEFVEGSSHLLDDEILQYDHSHHNGSPGARVLTLTDDEDDLTDDDER
ncbi:nuclear envelope integral membrane protein 1 isoform X2 [Hyalella azteca]|uniref:Nuclear envelope integral membrane protein 1 isoform X2 n=1 Tax=Hyalella azteca TaxID=294128 RepID=A0A979FS92_HYAAZ|nr:nuclear envelope integral membrane protein 1 isoform X2 [Hyalella azteca]